MRTGRENPSPPEVKEDQKGLHAPTLHRQLRLPCEARVGGHLEAFFGDGHLLRIHRPVFLLTTNGGKADWRCPLRVLHPILQENISLRDAIPDRPPMCVEYLHTLVQKHQVGGDLGESHHVVGILQGLHQPV